MKDAFHSLIEIEALSRGKNIDGEAAFKYPSIIDAISVCTKRQIAVLGVELFNAMTPMFQAEAVSTYELKLERRSWAEFVDLNNSLAVGFVEQFRHDRDYIYLLTTASLDEFAGLSQHPLNG